MPSDPPRFTLAGLSITIFAVLLVAALVAPLPWDWLADALLILAGIATGPAVVVLAQHFGPDGDGGSRAANALLVVLYSMLIGIFSFNVFVLEIATGSVRAFTLVVIGMTVPAALLSAGRAVGRVPNWASH